MSDPGRRRPGRPGASRAPSPSDRPPPTSLPRTASLDGCFHGGAFFEAIGPELGDLRRRHGVINADVLDAWFPPAPSVLAALTEDLPWLLRTSPPTACEGLVSAVERERGLPAGSVLPGAGSSDLIYRAFGAWLTPASRVLLLDPTYGEYAHVCEQVIGCTVERMLLDRDDGYRLDPERLAQRLGTAYDLVVLVNPNNPTGQHLSRADLVGALDALPPATRCWIDEAYIDYAGPDQSLEAFAAASPNVFVCKSLSKAYALSGLRAAYLVGDPEALAELRRLTPPWAVSLPAQVAAVQALAAHEYHAARHRETHALRDELAHRLAALDPRGEVIPSVANWVLWFPGADLGRSPADIARRARTLGLYVREFDRSAGGSCHDALRIAVKDAETNARLLATLAWASGPVADADSAEGCAAS
jgi:histidinol-phosphate/aromatic aminotransferase/cobyric acid decarboxylase-like protein